MYSPLFTANLISLIDHTCLNEQATADDIVELCRQAKDNQHEAAAVCVYPNFIKLAKDQCQDSQVKVATVINFPQGRDSVASSCEAIANAVEQGADEIDIVMPYQQLLQDNTQVVLDYLTQCHRACQQATYKVILETGALPNPAVIRLAADVAIAAGADFIKTSTGKIKQGATSEAVEVMLTAIKEASIAVGLKVSGGVRTVADAWVYWQLVAEQMGESWITPNTLRFGASRLLADARALK